MPDHITPIFQIFNFRPKSDKILLVKNAPLFFPVGDSSLTVSFGNSISVEFNQVVTRLAGLLEDKYFPGFVETVPAYSSLAVFYDLIKVRKHFPESPTAFAAVKGHIEALLEEYKPAGESGSRLVEIPFSFADEFALDLEFISETKDLSKTEIIEIFTSRTYRVFMLGFLPGFAYMGETDDRLAVSRKETPRLKIPKGSVGLAGRQTGIYPLESPGGWQIIGKTEIEMFTPEKERPTFLEAGDTVRFIAEK